MPEENQDLRSQEQIPYLPNTDRERTLMLKEIGVANFEELIAHVPKEVRVKSLELASGLSELELIKEIAQLAAKNKPTSQQLSFLGGGSTRRFVPSVVSSVISRSEFATAYTPYQPEVAQGSLQAIYEFQTAISLITGMDVANASMYDGPTALAEAALMAHRLTNREQILISRAVNPEYKMVASTYTNAIDFPFQELNLDKGATCTKDLESKISKETACVIVQYPNHFGVVEELSLLAQIAHDNGALLVVVSDPISLGLLKPPGELGGDIVVGDGQSCGNFLSFGGPSLGYMACRKDYVRQLPGRLAGLTTDNRGQTAYTLTLQTREQHIRRAKATSNICTNQALNALAMLVYLTSMGPQGLRDLANISIQRAHYLAEKLIAVDGIKLAFDRPFFNEFVLSLPQTLKVETLLNALKEKNILGGLSLRQHYPELNEALLVTVTEMNSLVELDTFAMELETIVRQLACDNTGKKVLTV